MEAIDRERVIDPLCNHSTEFAGRVSSHEDLPSAGQAHASTYVCSRPDCVQDAEEWVRELTHRKGVFYPFPDPDARVDYDKET